MYAANLHQSLLGLHGLATLDEVAGRIRQACNTASQNDTPSELDTNGNAVLPSVIAILDAVVDAGSKQKADGDAELVTGHKRATDLFGADLRHVENDNGGLETDTDSSDSSAGYEKVPARCSDLENHTCDGISGQFALACLLWAFLPMM
jgi:hypothetical protein